MRRPWMMRDFILLCLEWVLHCVWVQYQLGIQEHWLWGCLCFCKMTPCSLRLYKTMQSNTGPKLLLKMASHTTIDRPSGGLKASFYFLWTHLDLEERFKMTHLIIVTFFHSSGFQLWCSLHQIIRSCALALDIADSEWQLCHLLQPCEAQGMQVLLSLGHRGADLVPLQPSC